MTVAVAAAAIAILTASGYLCLLVDTLAHGRFPRPRQRTALVAAIVVCSAVAVLHDARSELVPPAVVLVTAIFPIVVAIAIGIGKRGRGRLADIGQRVLVGSQTFRVVGIVWLVYGATGALPLATAIPLGLIEVGVGVLAPLVAGLRRDVTYRVAAVGAWNLLGLVAALAALGLARVPGAFPLGVLTFFVEPVAVALHVLSLTALIHRRTVAYLRGA